MNWISYWLPNYEQHLVLVALFAQLYDWHPIGCIVYGCSVTGSLYLIGPHSLALPPISSHSLALTSYWSLLSSTDLLLVVTLSHWPTNGRHSPALTSYWMKLSGKVLLLIETLWHWPPIGPHSLALTSFWSSLSGTDLLLVVTLWHWPPIGPHSLALTSYWL